MIRKIHEGYKIAEAKGQLKPGTAFRATIATVLEAGIVAFHKAYFGAQEWATVESDVKANRQAGETGLALQESLLSDVTRVRRELREAHTSTDFPIVLANIRDRVLRQSYNPVQSAIWEMAQKRTATDFKIMKGYRVGTMEELTLRPEGTDVDMTTIEYTEDGYSVANYEKGIAFTWEAWKNDDLSIFTVGLTNLGLAANRTRAKVALRAISNGITPTTPPTAGVGGPTIERLTEVVDILAARTNDAGESLDVLLTDIAYGAKWMTTANSTLNSQNVLGPTSAKTPQANPVYGAATPHLERIMASVLVSDWLAWDNTRPFLEVAALEGFEAGPRTYTKMPDVLEHEEEGSFDNHSIGVKVGDTVGAKVIDTKGVIRVAGA